MVDPNPGGAPPNIGNIHDRPNLERSIKNRIEIVPGGEDRQIPTTGLKVLRLHHKRTVEPQILKSGINRIMSNIYLY